MARKYFRITPKSCVIITAFIKDKEIIVNELTKIDDEKAREKRANELVRDLDFHIQEYNSLPKNWEEIKKVALTKRDELLNMENKYFNVKIPINERTINYIKDLKKAEHIDIIEMEL